MNYLQELEALEFGLEKADSSWETVWANQWEPGKKAQYAFDCYVNHFGNEIKYVNEDIAKINKKDIPDHNLLVGGFPCQSFSIAGARKGFDDTRGTLFFEIARIAAVKKPKYLFLENVPGLLNHDSGRTFKTILRTLDELGYDVCWQVLNSKNFGVPQSRNRVFIIGYLRGQCAGEVLSFTQTSGKALIQRKPNTR